MSFFESSDDEMDSNLHLAERLMIDTAEIAADESMDWVDTGSKIKKSAIRDLSTTMENQKQDGSSGSALFQFGAHKKRQNGDKSGQQSKHPKRTCLNDEARLPVASTSKIPIPNGSALSMSKKGPTFNQKPDKNEKNSASSKRILNHFFCSTSDEDSNTMPLPGVLESADPRGTSQTENLRLQPNGYSLTSSRKVSSVNKTEKNPVHSSRMHKNVLYYSASDDDDSRTIPIIGALKGGRQTPTEQPKKSVGRQVDAPTNPIESGGNRCNGKFRSRCFIFTSSDSDDSCDWEERKTSPKFFPNPSCPAKKSSTRPAEKFVKLSKAMLGIPSTSSQQELDSTSKSNSAAVLTNPKPSTSKAVAVNEGASCSGLSFTKKPTSQALRRHFPRLSKKPNSTSSNPGLVSTSGHTETMDLGERAGTLPRSKERSCRKKTRESSLRKEPISYSDFFAADDVDSDSEVEFFTANSYSDAEGSSAYRSNVAAGGHAKKADKNSRPQSSGINRARCNNKPVSIRLESSEDEISVVYSNAPDGRSARQSNRRKSEPKPSKRRSVLRTPVRQPVSRSPVANLVSSSPDPVEQVRQVEEDERLARQLQAQFDSERDPPFHPTSSIPSCRVNLPMIRFPSVVSDSSSSDGDDIDLSSMRQNFTEQYMRSVSAVLGRRQAARSRRGGPRARVPRSPDSRYHDFAPMLVDIMGRLEQQAPFSFLIDRHIGGDYEALLNLEELNGGDHNRGLNRTDIGRLPTRKYTVPGIAEEPLHKRAELNKECQVCLMDYVDGDVLRILPCFHEFHTPCIDPWLKSNRTCPVCRVVVNLDESIDVD